MAPKRTIAKLDQTSGVEPIPSVDRESDSGNDDDERGSLDDFIEDDEYKTEDGSFAGEEDDENVDSDDDVESDGPEDSEDESGTTLSRDMNQANILPEGSRRVRKPVTRYIQELLDNDDDVRHLITSDLGDEVEAALVDENFSDDESEDDDSDESAEYHESSGDDDTEDDEVAEEKAPSTSSTKNTAKTAANTAAFIGVAIETKKSVESAAIAATSIAGAVAAPASSARKRKAPNSGN